MIKRQLDEMQNRQRAEEDRYNRKVMDYNVDAQQKMNNAEKGQESQSITEQAAKARGEIMGAAASVSEFSYVMNKDGSRVNYIDGLPSSILDERVIDMWGGVSLKDTWNMTYKDRFLISYEAAIKDPAGNITKISWFGAEYSPDSVWWASEDSAAGKYLLRYSEIITDPYGTVTTREWSATRENYGSDKKLDGYHEVVKDASGGIILESDRSNIQYDGDKTKSYHEETRDNFGNMGSLDWSAKYNQNGLLEEATSTETQTKDTGSETTVSRSTNISAYTYDAITGKLASAVGQGTFNSVTEGIFINSRGEEVGRRRTSRGTTRQEYEIVNGQAKLVRNISIANYSNPDGSTAHSESIVTYVYGPTNLLTGARGVTNTTGEDVFGNGYATVITDAYEIIASQARRIHSVTSTESEDIFGSGTTSETINDYSYEIATGKLISAVGYTNTKGIDVFGTESITRTEHTYQIINGEAKLIRSETKGDAIVPGSRWLGLLE